MSETLKYIFLKETFLQISLRQRFSWWVMLAHFNDICTTRTTYIIGASENF